MLVAAAKALVQARGAYYKKTHHVATCCFQPSLQNPHTVFGQNVFTLRRGMSRKNETKYPQMLGNKGEKATLLQYGGAGTGHLSVNYSYHTSARVNLYIENMQRASQIAPHTWYHLVFPTIIKIKGIKLKQTAGMCLASRSRCHTYIAIVRSDTLN